MLPNVFGEYIQLYDLIGVCGYVLIIVFFLRQRKALTVAESGKSGVWLLLTVHLLSYTFGGELMGGFLGRRTEFFGFLLLAMVVTEISDLFDMVKSVFGL